MKECKICGIPFNATRSKITCSEKCSHINYKKLNAKWCKNNRPLKSQTCVVCENIFKNTRDRKCCSNKCHKLLKRDMFYKNGGFYCDKHSDTRIERMVENWLLFNNILYIKQFKYGKGSADFWLPETNEIIECDGDYWHNLPEYKIRDKKQTEYLEKQEYIVHRFWEHDIINNVNKCMESTGW